MNDPGARCRLNHHWFEKVPFRRRREQRAQLRGGLVSIKGCRWRSVCCRDNGMQNSKLSCPQSKSYQRAGEDSPFHIGVDCHHAKPTRELIDCVLAIVHADIHDNPIMPSKRGSVTNVIIAEMSFPFVACARADFFGEALAMVQVGGLQPPTRRTFQRDGRLFSIYDTGDTRRITHGMASVRALRIATTGVGTRAQTTSALTNHVHQTGGCIQSGIQTSLVHFCRV